MFNSAFMEFPVLVTDRLVLREINRSDVDEVYEIFSSIEVAEFSSHYPVKSKEQVLRGIDRWKAEYVNKEQIRWGIALKDSDILIGTCCLGDFDEDARRCEIGYHLSYNYWSKGYMTEALKAMVTYGFEKGDINRVEAFVTPGNFASVLVLKKLGFVEEGLLRQRDFFKGQFQDGIVLGMLKSDYMGA